MNQVEKLNYWQTSEQLTPAGLEDVSASLRELSMPYDEYYVIGGANLVLRGIKDYTTDIDVLVSDRLFNELGTHPDAKIKRPPQRAIDKGATNDTVWIKYEGLRVPLSATSSLNYDAINDFSEKDIDLYLQ